MSVMPNYVPRSFKTINLLLKVSDGERALRFYNNAFGAEIIDKMVDGDGIIQYAEFKIDDTIVMLTEDKTFTKANGVVIQLYTGDAEAVFDSALMAGAEKIHPIEKHFYGDRSGKVKDPFGYEWVISTHMEDVPPNEIKKRFDSLYS